MFGWKDVRPLVCALEARAGRSMSTSAKVWINKETKVICQGFTGKQVRLISLNLIM